MIDLALVKLHLRVDGDEEDALIGVYVQAALGHAMQYLNRRLIATEDAREGDCDALVINADIQAAVLLLVGHLYANREEEAANTHIARLQFASHNLLVPYRLDMGV